VLRVSVCCVADAVVRAAGDQKLSKHMKKPEDVVAGDDDDDGGEDADGDSAMADGDASD
jgi:hypothetical protein